MVRTISQVLLEDHSLSIGPGRKGECPFCRHQTFSVKADDMLGKCFHPACGRLLTTRDDDSAYRVSLTRVLDAVYQDCHQEFVSLASGHTNAYTYLLDERGIHPTVITDAMLGAVPSGYDVVPHFQPVIADAQAAVAALQANKRGRPPRDLTHAEKRLTDLQEAQQKLVDCLAHKAGWLVFFYTDAAHRCVALRLRQPYSKQFTSFKPGSAGVFARELFTPYATPSNQARMISSSSLKGNSTRCNCNRSPCATRRPQGRRSAMSTPVRWAVSRLRTCGLFSVSVRIR